MALSTLLYGGLLVIGAGLLSIVWPLRFLGVRTRRAGAFVLAVGLAASAAAVAWPAPTQRAGSPGTRIDGALPEWQFGERHETRVHAAPARVMEAVRAVTPEEIRFFATLTGIRALPARLLRKRPPQPKQPPRPLLEMFLHGGFVMLDEGEEELVFGEVGRVWRPVDAGPIPKVRDGAEFAALRSPGVVKVAADLRAVPDGDGWTRLTTETRVAGVDPGAVRRFAVYWRLIYPGSSLLRTTWLAAIKARAEAPAKPT